MRWCTRYRSERIEGTKAARTLDHYEDINHAYQRLQHLKPFTDPGKYGKVWYVVEEE